MPAQEWRVKVCGVERLLFTELKRIAQQLTPLECWCRILAEAMKKYLKGDVLKPPDRLLLSA